MVENDHKFDVGAMELVGTFGFSLAVCAFLSCMFMMPDGFPSQFSLSDQCLVKGMQLAGAITTYLAVHLTARHFMDYAFRSSVLVAVSALFALMPIVYFAANMGFPAPLPAYCGCSFATGLASAYITLCWLDICSRVRVRRSTTFTTGAFAAGGLLMAMLWLMPAAVQPCFVLLLLVADLIMIVFVGTRTSKASPDVVPRSEYLRFTREIEPAFMIIGIAFGIALSYLYCSGGVSILLLAVSVMCGGAAALVAASVLGDRIDDVTILLRSASSVIFITFAWAPFAPPAVRIGLFCAVTAAWAFFTSLNYALLVKRNKSRNLFVFWNISACMAVKPLGVLVGWLVGGIVLFPAGDTVGIVVSLSVVAALGVDLMAFLPVTRHHDDWTDGRAAAPVRESESEGRYGIETESAEAPVSDEVLEQRCSAVADLYQLSPRESELLLYLARGRNAAYIQRQLTISPNTIKTHIYKIYRKLGIHSQQQLMDLIEEFALASPKGQRMQPPPHKFVPPGRPLR